MSEIKDIMPPHHTVSTHNIRSDIKKKKEDMKKKAGSKKRCRDDKSDKKIDEYI